MKEMKAAKQFYRLMDDADLLENFNNKIVEYEKANDTSVSKGFGISGRTIFNFRSDFSIKIKGGNQNSEEFLFWSTDSVRDALAQYLNENQEQVFKEMSKILRNNASNVLQEAKEESLEFNRKFIEFEVGLQKRKKESGKEG